MSPGGSMVPRYVSQLLFSEKSQNCETLNNHYSEKKITTDFESLEFYKFLGACLTKFKNNQILLNKISHTFNQDIY